MKSIAPAIPENLGVFVKEGVAKVSSLRVAEMFGKRHRHVIRDIETKILNVAPAFTQPNFGLSEYTAFTERNFALSE
jgi:Rha family phage regulatory protein